MFFSDGGKKALAGASRRGFHGGGHGVVNKIALKTGKLGPAKVTVAEVRLGKGGFFARHECQGEER